MNVTGNIAGLKASQLKALEQLYRKRIHPMEWLSAAMLTAMTTLSQDIRRQLGILVGRKGQIDQVFVGDFKRVFLPDLGRQRAGQQHLRGLRHIRTSLNATGIVADDLADLRQLRLDGVAVVMAPTTGSPQCIEYAYLQADKQQALRTVTERVRQLSLLPSPFDEWINDVERNVMRFTSAAAQVALVQHRAVLLGVYENRNQMQWRLAELRELCKTADLKVVDEVVQLRAQVDAKYVVGRGKMQEAATRCVDVHAGLMVIDGNLSPTQARVIAGFCDLKVIDRTQLILDIFAQHARSRDGALQVELAQLRYRLPRLTYLDTGLSRLTGGIGGRGPGETKLEINRRRARERITRLEHTLEQLTQQRHLRRKQRSVSGLPVVSIIGYTNAGKSTLLHALTGNSAPGQDYLFATLDPATRRVHLTADIQVVMTDTVGFIRDLPKDLLAAFRATLEELADADVLLHVLDVSEPIDIVKQKAQTVRDLLKQLEVHTIPELLVLNKVDLADSLQVKTMQKTQNAVAISAQKCLHLDVLKQRLASCLAIG